MKTKIKSGLFLVFFATSTLLNSNLALANETINPIVKNKADIQNSLFPLAVGLKWVYQINSNSAYCQSGPREIVVRQQGIQDEIPYFLVDHTCSYFADGALEQWVKDDSVYSIVATSAVSLSLSSPMIDKQSWNMNSSVIATWNKVGTVKVAAGTFTDCWSVSVVPWISKAYYCRGVGVVKVDGDFSTELISFDFSAVR